MRKLLGGIMSITLLSGLLLPITANGLSLTVNGTTVTSNGNTVTNNGITVTKTATVTTAATNITKDAVITANNSTIKIGSSFNPMKNVSARDNGGSGKSLTSKIKVSGRVNTKVAGEYVITYRVAGANGKTVAKAVKVTVVNARTNIIKDAVITANDSTINIGDTFNPMKKVSARDNGGSGKSLTSKIKVSGKVNTNIAGEYNVTYRVTGANNKTVTKRVTVTVVGVTDVLIPTIVDVTETVIQTDTSTSSAIYNSMMALKAQYPDGTPWTNDNSYTWKGGIYSGGSGCAGFAMMLSDAAFGDLPARKVTNFSNIRVGDIIRMNNDTHSVIVLSIDGNNITIAEGNFNSSVKWGRVITLDDVLSTGVYLLTRYSS